MALRRWVLPPRCAQRRLALALGVGAASAGLAACCRCDSPRDARERNARERSKRPLKKDAEEPLPNEDAPSGAKKQARKKEARAVATPRVDPLLELRHRQRMVFISGSISDALAKAVVADLLYLDALEDGTADPAGPRPIQLVINSGGGSVTAGLAIYDVMQYIRSPVHTLCIGNASSMAAILLAAGEPRQRRALPHARIMIHSASGGYGRNKVEDVLVHAEELRAKNDLLAAILADHLGLSVEQVTEMWSIDNYMRCAPRLFARRCARAGRPRRLPGLLPCARCLVGADSGALPPQPAGSCRGRDRRRDHLAQAGATRQRGGLRRRR